MSELNREDLFELLQLALRHGVRTAAEQRVVIRLARLYDSSFMHWSQLAERSWMDVACDECQSIGANPVTGYCWDCSQEFDIAFTDMHDEIVQFLNNGKAGGRG